MQKLFSQFGMFCATALIFIVLMGTVLPEDKINKILPQLVHAIDLNKGFNLAGEPVPSTFDAMERLDRELTVNAYWQSSTLLNLKNANRYFPTIERILGQHGIPSDFKYLAVAESNLRNATSSASAKGIWQFMKLAGKEFDLEINSEVDERYHLEKATHAAAKYIKQLHNRFGSWTSAAAAYNMGPTAFRSSLKAQDASSYYDLNLNAETARYVFRIIAIKEIMQDPSNYGFFVDHHEMYAPLDNYYEVTVDKSVTSWSKFAKEHGITYRTLKVYNPWLRDNKLTVKSNTYKIKIPRK